MKAFEMMMIIFEALAIDDIEKTPRKQCFAQYGYKGTLYDLRLIVEHLCIERKLIDKVVDLPNGAWGTPGDNPIYQVSTNFDEQHLNLFTEQIHLMCARNIISPGAYRSYGPELPYFHVTEYGLQCIHARHILPYDQDGYIAQIKSCVGYDDWDVYYLEQCLKCFNHGLYDAATMTLGIASEYLVERLINEYCCWLKKHEPSKESALTTVLNKTNKMSDKYAEYRTSMESVANMKDTTGAWKYSDLHVYKTQLDSHAQNAFMNYLRMTRNSLAHPAQYVMDDAETMLLIVSYVSYFKKQQNFLQYYILN